MKNILLIVLLFAVGSYAGMIDLLDDDPLQVIYFDNCDSTIDSTHLWVMINPDSGFYYYGPVTNDSVRTTGFNYIAPDTDGDDNLIPGHYEGEYWYYAISYNNNQGIIPIDTTHQFVSYDISGGCSGRHVVD